MLPLRSKDKRVIIKKEGAKGASPLLMWMKGGARKGNAMKEPGVNQEVNKEDEEDRGVKSKVKGPLKKRNSKEGDNKDEDSEVSDEAEEEQEEWKPTKKVVLKVKKVGKSNGKKIKLGSKRKVNKRKQEEEETEEGEEEEEVKEKVEEEELKPEKKVAPTRLKRDTKPKKEELDDENVLDEEGEEAQQDEDAKVGTVGGADFNEYERQRQENILKNKLLLQQLQLDSIALGPKPKPKPKPAHKPVHRKKKEPSVSTTEHVPRRQSSRIAGLPADSEKAKRKYEEESAALEQAERAKRMRVGGDIKFDVGGIDLSARGARYERTFTDEDVKNTDNTDVKKLREKMMGLKLYERWAPNGGFYKEVQFPTLSSCRLITDLPWPIQISKLPQSARYGPTVIAIFSRHPTDPLSSTISVSTPQPTSNSFLLETN